jgi:polyisoprenoid-binding protein YceI
MISSAAVVPMWKIMPSASSITFTAMQNGAPVTGQFERFLGDIKFDPEHLNASVVQITVDMSSVSAPYDEVIKNLKTADWFDVQQFPKAIFKASHFVKLSNGAYQGDGMLTIRDKSVPVTIHFVIDELTSNKAHVKGDAILKRTQFGVGQGEWASTNLIKDDVKLDFTITADR